MLRFLFLVIWTVRFSVVEGFIDSEHGIIPVVVPKSGLIETNNRTASNFSRESLYSAQEKDNFLKKNMTESGFDRVNSNSNLISPQTICGTLVSGSGLVHTRYGYVIVECVMANMTAGFIVKNLLGEYLHCDFIVSPAIDDFQHFIVKPVWRMMSIIEKCSNLEPARIGQINSNVYWTLHHWVYSFFNMVWPRTLWCGLGTLAVNWNHLGAGTDTDRCCRQHDFCPIRIPEPGAGPGITQVTCQCDRRFKQCLLDFDSPTSRVVYFVYFVALQSDRHCIDTDWSGRVQEKVQKSYRQFDQGSKIYMN